MHLRHLLPACALATCLFYADMSTAQTTPDSAYFDLGRVKLQKNFTQNINIKGADLQRFPFANLAEAVNVWFSGNYTHKNNLVYVVDGKLITDANQYAIQDIEEITLVQNAAGAVNGVSQLRQLILVKTKRHLDQQSGIEVSAQANLNRSEQYSTNFSGANSRMNMFHQYHVSAFKNYDKIHFGASANYLHDASPFQLVNNVQETSTPVLNRWRFNGYFNADVWEGSSLDINVGYAPQKLNEGYTYSSSGYVTNYRNRITENIFNTSLSLSSQIVPGLTNHLKAGYSNSKNELNNFSNQTNPNYSPSTSININDTRWDNLLLSDELRYTYTAGNFTISPAVNFSYRYLKSRLNYSGVFQGQVLAAGETINTIKNSLLTPTLALSYKELVNITGGLLYIIKASPETNVQDYKKTFPFLTATVDVAKLISEESLVNVKLYGSYAISNSYNDFYATLTDYTPVTQYSYNSFLPLFSSPVRSLPYKNYKTLALGTDVGLLNNKLILSYNYENRKTFNYFSESYTASSYYAANIYVDAEYASHRVSAAYNFVNKKDFTWNTALNTTTIKPDKDNVLAYIPYLQQAKNIWTGGFTNRLQYKNWVAGLDLLYLFGKDDITNTQIPNPDSFSLQNIYLGLNIKTDKVKNLEVFVNGRDLSNSNKLVFTQNRQYFGLGVKAGL